MAKRTKPQQAGSPRTLDRLERDLKLLLQIHGTAYRAVLHPLQRLLARVRKAERR